jgi:hypothetical protein
MLTWRCTVSNLILLSFFAAGAVDTCYKYSDPVICRNTVSPCNCLSPCCATTQQGGQHLHRGFHCQSGGMFWRAGHFHNRQGHLIHLCCVDFYLHPSTCSPMPTTLRAMGWWSAFTGRSLVLAQPDTPIYPWSCWSYVKRLRRILLSHQQSW